MKDLTIKEIVEVSGGTYVGPEYILEKSIEGVVIDSRLVRKNYVFVAFVGENVDGHSYALAAIKNGALLVIVEKDMDGDFPYLKVDSSAKALQEIAKYYRMKKDIKVIGITGSVGKTSTKELIAAVSATNFKTYKTIGNFNNELGLPLTLLQVDDEKVVVLEMGISDFGEMHLLADIARPDICIITNIGLCHLETLGDRKGVLKAKSEIFDFATENTKVILNADDDLLRTVTVNEPTFYGISSANVHAKAVNIKEKGIAGIEFDALVGDRTIEGIVVPLPGRHMVSNALAGICVGEILGIKDEDIIKGIASLKAVSGRNNIIKTDRFTVIDDCYNANPVSMKAAIDILSKADRNGGRRVAILGDMFELGADEVILHSSVGDHINAKDIDVVVCIGNLASNIAKSINSGSIKVYEFAKVEDFIKNMNDVLFDKDIILVKASHGMNFAQIVKECL